MQSSRHQRRAQTRREIWITGASVVGYLFALSALWMGWRVIAMPAAIAPVVLAAWFFGALGAVPLALALAALHISFFVSLEGGVGSQQTRQVT